MHYEKQIKSYPPKLANKKGYITKMLINFLRDEYEELNAYGNVAAALPIDKNIKL